MDGPGLHSEHSWFKTLTDAGWIQILTFYLWKSCMPSRNMEKLKRYQNFLQNEKEPLKSRANLRVQVRHQQAGTPSWPLGLRVQLLIFSALTATASLPVQKPDKSVWQGELQGRERQEEEPKIEPHISYVPHLNTLSLTRPRGNYDISIKCSKWRHSFRYLLPVSISAAWHGWYLAPSWEVSLRGFDSGLVLRAFLGGTQCKSHRRASGSGADSVQLTHQPQHWVVRLSSVLRRVLWANPQNLLLRVLVHSA